MIERAQWEAVFRDAVMPDVRALWPYAIALNVIEEEASFHYAFRFSIAHNGELPAGATPYTVWVKGEAFTTLASTTNALEVVAREIVAHLTSLTTQQESE